MNGEPSGPSIDYRIRRLEAVEDVRNLKTRYAYHHDHGWDAEAVSKLFTEEAVWTSPQLGTHVGRQAIMELTRESAAALPWTVHMNVNPKIDLNRPLSSGTLRCELLQLATHVGEDGDEVPVLAVASYVDEVVYVDGGWLFEKVSVDFAFISSFVRGWVEDPMRRGS